MKAFLFVFLITIISFSAYSQKLGNTLLVNFQNKEYFAPDILNCLNMLHKQSNDSEKSFDKIIVLNQLNSHIKEQAGIKELIDYFRQDLQYKDIDNSAKRQYDSIAHYLGSYTSYLDINTNLINDLVEIQFSLYNNIINDDHLNFPTKVPLYPDKYQSTIFAPQENNYFQLIDKSIKQLFPDTNLSPTLNILINGQRFSIDKEINFSTGDTITLDGSLSFDPDSRNDDLQFQWKEFDSINQITPIFYSKAKISRVYHESGKYYFNLSVSDNISEASNQTLCINIVPKPDLYIRERIVEIPYQNSFRITERKKHRIEKSINVASNNPATDPSYLIVRDLNEFSFLASTNPLQLAEEHLSRSNKAPSLDTIYNIQIPSDFDNNKRDIALDSITALRGGYRLFFSGYPGATDYTFQIHEQYNGIKSKPINVNFHVNYLSSIKFGLKYQISSLSSKKSSQWGELSPGSDTAILDIFSKSFQPFISFYITDRFVANLFFIQAFKRESPRTYLPIYQFCYEFGNPEYLKLAPTISIGNIQINSNDDNTSSPTLLGFGGTATRCYSNSIFLSISLEYNIGLGSGFSGFITSYGVVFDLNKIINDLFKIKHSSSINF